MAPGGIPSRLPCVIASSPPSFLRLFCRSSPVHWYYNPRDIASEYGLLTDFKKPKATHPSSILNLSNTGGAGRGGKEGNIIGDVINHGKKQYWLKPGSHYHGTLEKGENTLNAQCARLLVRTMVENGRYDKTDFLTSYIKFMTTPGSHNDTYAESYHRMFFLNLVVKGKKPEDCSDDDHHNISSMGGFVLLPPVALYAATRAAAAVLATKAPVTAATKLEAAPSFPLDAPEPLTSVLSADAIKSIIAASVDATVKQQYATHRSAELEANTRIYAKLLAIVLLDLMPLKEAVAQAGKELGVDIPAVARKVPLTRDTLQAASSVIGRVFTSACYIEGSFPSLLYLAYALADDPEAAVIANTNAGGENCHRGSALGALMGAAHGKSKWPERWTKGLHNVKEIEAEAEAFSKLCLNGAAGGAAAGGAGETAAVSIAAATGAVASAAPLS